MRKSRRTEITLQAEESFTIRADKVLFVHCLACNDQVRMVAANEAAMISRLSAREVYRLVEDGQLHFIEDNNGLLYVCAKSLREHENDSKP